MQRQSPVQIGKANSGCFLATCWPMAKPASSTVLPVAAMGTLALWAPGQLMQGFVPAGVPRTPTAGNGVSGLAGSPASAAFATAAAATGIAAAALSMGTVAAAGRVLAGSRSHRSAAVRRAELVEAPFAGGLIGNESALKKDFNFDPLGIAERCPQYLPWFREAELKHGRIAMLAWVGLVVPEMIRIPGPAECYQANVIDAHFACIGADQKGPLQQIYVFCALLEMTTCFPKCIEGLTLKNAGDYQLGVNFLPKDEQKIKEMKLKELKNGRLAMLAFGGAITQAVLTGNNFPWLYAKREGQHGPGLGSSIPHMGGRASGSSRLAMSAYKMSKAVPFLPVSPALEGYVGEEDGFDPMGFSLAIDIRWLREAELKHARVAMLATVGWIATDMGMRVPGEAFQVSTIEAHDAMVKFGSMPQMLCWLGYAELFGFLAIINMMEGKTERKPGDFGIRALYPNDEQGQKDMQLKELRNGRLAMLAFSGIQTVAVLTGKTFPFFAVGNGGSRPTTVGTGPVLCGGLQKPAARSATAARALETSRSLPFLPKPKNLDGLAGGEAEFDPLDFSGTFDVRWLREAELKHGRVCMLATLGFVTQQFVTFPGVPACPDSLMAVYSAPPPYWAALILGAGFIESSSYDGKLTMLDMFEDGREPGNFNFGTRFLAGKSEADINDTKAKELNNGRLAMLAFGGMVHHNLVVSGPLFPLFPEGWAGPQYTWKLTGVMDAMAGTA